MTAGGLPLTTMRYTARPEVHLDQTTQTKLTRFMTVFRRRLSGELGGSHPNRCPARQCP